MSVAAKRTVIVVFITLGVIAASIFYLGRTRVYGCTNSITGMPAFVDIKRHNLVGVFQGETKATVKFSVHHPDGEVYAYLGFSESFGLMDDHILAEFDAPYFPGNGAGMLTRTEATYLNLRTGSYTVRVVHPESENIVASGVCRKI